MNLDLYIELYKRKQYHLIPLGKLPEGEFFYPTKKQIQAFEILNTTNGITCLGYGGSARSGKTILEVTDAAMLCQAYAGITVAICRKELVNLKRTVLVSLFNQLNFYGIDDYLFKSQENKIVFSNGSVIWLIDSKRQPSDPLYTRFGGFEPARVYVDESNESEEEFIDKMVERSGWCPVGQKHNLERKVFETFNPDKNHVNRRYWVPFRDNKEETHTKFIRALPSDNPHPSVKVWCDQVIEKGNKIQIERQINGNFDYDDDDSKYLSYGEIMGMFDNPLIENLKGQKFITADVAMEGADTFVLYVWTINIKSKKLILERVYELAKCDAPKARKFVKDIQKEWNVPNRNICYDADGNGSVLKGEVRGSIDFVNNGKNLIPKKDHKKFSNNASYCLYKFCNDLVKKNSILIKDQRHKDRMIAEIEQAKNHNNGLEKEINTDKKEIKKILGNKSPDHMDAMKMVYSFFVRPKGVKVTTSTPKGY